MRLQVGVRRAKAAREGAELVLSRPVHRVGRRCGRARAQHSDGVIGAVRCPSRPQHRRIDLDVAVGWRGQCRELRLELGRRRPGQGLRPGPAEPCVECARDGVGAHVAVNGAGGLGWIPRRELGRPIGSAGELRRRPTGERRLDRGGLSGLRRGRTLRGFGTERRVEERLVPGAGVVERPTSQLHALLRAAKGSPGTLTIHPDVLAAEVVQARPCLGGGRIGPARGRGALHVLLERGCRLPAGDRSDLGLADADRGREGLPVEPEPA